MLDELLAPIRERHERCDEGKPALLKPLAHADRATLLELMPFVRHAIHCAANSAVTKGGCDCGLGATLRRIQEEALDD